MKNRLGKRFVLVCLGLCTFSVLGICAMNFNDSQMLTDAIVNDSAKASENKFSHQVATALTSQTRTLLRQEDGSTDQHQLTSESAMTQEDVDLINLSEKDAWELLTGGIYSSQPNNSFSVEKNKLETIKEKQSTYIEVDVWYWADPSDQSNMDKVTVKKKFQVNKNIASLFEHAFADAYNDPEQPVYNIADTGGGGWSCRGKSNVDSRKPSSHSYGCCVDINPATSISVDGHTYGNGQPQNPIPQDVWEQLPENHKKYHLMRKQCAWVRHFEHYGFVWGGEFSPTYRDPMHLSWIGEYPDTRSVGQKNYSDFQ